MADETGMKQKGRGKKHIIKNQYKEAGIRAVSGGVNSEMSSSWRKMQRTIKGIINVCLE